MKQDPVFIQAQHTVVENINILNVKLNQCEDLGMIDYSEECYNALSELHDVARGLKSWESLDETVSRARAIEMDLDTWLSIHGRSTLSLDWPKKPNS